MYTYYKKKMIMKIDINLNSDSFVFLKLTILEV